MMKYRNGCEIALLMGEMMADRFARPDADFLVPVPLHKSSDRDYNQAEIMARGAEKIWRIPVASPLRWCRGTQRQALKPGADRALSEDALTGRPLETGTRVFIVDDVYTSGSTMRTAARTLEKMGVSVTGAMVWSRSGGRVSKDDGEWGV
jgi:predicted amidophosphoribosyltransferase